MKNIIKRYVAITLTAVLLFTSAAFAGINTSYASTSKKTIYTKALWTTLFTKQNSKSSKIKVWYNTPLKKVSVKKVKNGKWTKVTYRKKTYYLWENKGTSKTRTTKLNTNFKSNSNTAYQNEVVTYAMKLYNTLNTKYDYSHKAALGKKTSDGKYAFDCSGFASYVLNGVLQKYCPAYNISRGDTELYETTNVLNEGLSGEFNAVTVCTRKPDFKKLQPGDLLFFKEDTSSKEKIDHVGIYLGRKIFIQSTKMYQRYPGDTIKYKGKKVSRGGLCLAPLNIDKYYKGFVAAKRFVPENFTEANVQAVTNDFTGLYAGTKCDGSSGNKKLVSYGRNESVTILYTLNRGDGKKVAYVRDTNGKKGYIIASKLTW